MSCRRKKHRRYQKEHPLPKRKESRRPELRVETVVYGVLIAAGVLASVVGAVLAFGDLVRG